MSTCHVWSAVLVCRVHALARLATEVPSSTTHRQKRGGTSGNSRVAAMEACGGEIDGRRVAVNHGGRPLGDHYGDAGSGFARDRHSTCHRVLGSNPSLARRAKPELHTRVGPHRWRWQRHNRHDPSGPRWAQESIARSTCRWIRQRGLPYTVLRLVPNKHLLLYDTHI